MQKITKLIAGVFCCAMVFSSSAYAVWLSDSQAIMGTSVTVELWADDEPQGQRAMQAVFTEMRRIDKAMNPWDEHSELAAINRQAAIAPVLISDELVQIINKALFYSQLSEGAFDISFASVSRFYNFRAGKKPSEQQRKAMQGAINYRNIQLDENAETLFFSDKRISIDLGGIAKGYAVDQGIALLAKHGITSAIVSAGGDSRILGDKHGKPWVMGIRHPRDKNKHALRIPLADTAISTSGDYERFFMEGDVRHHHIINPKTSYSAPAVQSVSVLANKAIDSDALSTTVFVLGVSKGLALINQLPGIDAIIIDGQGLLHCSDDLLMSQ
ncbi:FAD:protein FMN transferase [Dasania marina]|uniref:FAD:protein FMN transferase n=1 Tax=Dasania marina TaxID=471499 RepID=UPI00036D4715|nr:FAD:protein FMN transferase [Dasania marina]